MQRARLVGGIVLVAVMTTTACTGGDDASSGSSSDGGTSSAKVDATTLDGACSLLVGPADTYVDDALKVGKAVTASGGALEDVDGATDLQNQVFTLVADGPEEIKDPAGQLVDYLDDPAAYVTSGTLDPLVTGAVAEIKKLCAG